jgi:hypothetical protein
VQAYILACVLGSQSSFQCAFSLILVDFYIHGGRLYKTDGSITFNFQLWINYKLTMNCKNSTEIFCISITQPTPMVLSNKNTAYYQNQKIDIGTTNCLWYKSHSGFTRFCMYLFLFGEGFTFVDNSTAFFHIYKYT